jgi:hypothetical protein
MINPISVLMRSDRRYHGRQRVAHEQTQEQRDKERGPRVQRERQGDQRNRDQRDRARLKDVRGRSWTSSASGGRNSASRL